MAACLITVSGTTGKIELRYVIGIIPYKIQSNIGTFYIEDTATAVTYTTITGNAIASSACLTITPLPYICYSVIWNGLVAENYFIDAILLNSEILVIPDVPFTNAQTNFSEKVNNLNDDRIKVTYYDLDTPNVLDVATYQYKYIVKVQGTAIPWVRVKNNTLSGHLYVKGVLTVNCAPVGYTAIELCITEPLP